MVRPMNIIDPPLPMRVRQRAIAWDLRRVADFGNCAGVVRIPIEIDDKPRVSAAYRSRVKPLGHLYGDVPSPDIPGDMPTKVGRREARTRRKPAEFRAPRGRRRSGSNCPTSRSGPRKERARPDAAETAQNRHPFQKFVRRFRPCWNLDWRDEPLRTSVANSLNHDDE